MIQPKFVVGLSSHCCTSVTIAELELAVLDQEKVWFVLPARIKVLPLTEAL
jgi:hypothetical protein